MKRKILVVAYQMVENSPRYFVGQRPKQKIWALISAKVQEKGDRDLIATLKRELNEELGLKNYRNLINPKKYFYFKKGETKIKESVFGLELNHQKINLEKEEFSSYKFLKFAEIEKLLYWPRQKWALKIIHNLVIQKKYPKIFIVCGPSGSGKETIIRGVLQNIKNIRRAKTYTTRAKRPGEKTGGRIFISQKEFARLDAKGEIIEKNTYNSHWYGSSKTEIEKILSLGKNVLIEVDVNGVKHFQKQYSNTVVLFIKVDLKDLKKRLELRGRDTGAEIMERLKIAKAELQFAKKSDYIISNRFKKKKEAIGRATKLIKGEIS